MTKNLIFLHGLASNSQTYKASLIKQIYPNLIVPDFTGSLQERMGTLYPIMNKEKDWTIIGSSFGGLMGAIFTLQYPDRVRKLVLLAPALIVPDFASCRDLMPASVPTTIIHGKRDEIVPLEAVREIAKKAFSNLTYHIVEDDHRLHKTAETLNWKEFLI
ncbi:MAG: hypothetical protein Kow002_21350 [Anaerolineales bacterium]